jgi:hypothetical protein
MVYKTPPSFINLGYTTFGEPKTDIDNYFITPNLRRKWINPFQYNTFISYPPRLKPWAR